MKSWFPAKMAKNCILNRELLSAGSPALQALQRDFAALDAGRLRLDDFRLRCADARLFETAAAARLLRSLAAGASFSFLALQRALLTDDGPLDAAAAAAAAGGAAAPAFGIASETHRERTLHHYNTALASNIESHGPTLTARADRNELEARLDAAAATSAGAPVFSSKARQPTPQLQAESGAGDLIRGGGGGGGKKRLKVNYCHF